MRGIDDLRDAIDETEKRGIAAEYYLHALNYLLPRELFAKEPELFRSDDDGRRTTDYNGCPSNDRTLQIVSERAAALAARLGQRSHRYHWWQDDDLGGDVSCRCEKCRALTPAAQNLIWARAVWQGLRAYDPAAEISLLVYGEQDADIPLQDGVFLEFAPFRRAHDVPLAQGETNRAFRRKLERLLQTYPSNRVEVLEYFLSYDYAGFCRDGDRVRQDAAFYRSCGIERLASFAVFPQKEYVQTHGFDGIYKYFAI